MYLETIERGERRGGRRSLFFIHGFWQAAWTWDEHILGALADLGYHCVALSLRGHGGSEGRIRGTSIDDYVADVSGMIGRFDTPPILIGHSMGGFVAQHYLARGNPCRAVALISPVPVTGAWGATVKAIRRHPGKFLKTNLTLDVGPIVETRETAHDFLVSPTLPPSFIDPFLDRLERASYRAYLDLLFKLPDLSPVEVPSIVIGGADDGFFTEKEWRRTAEALGGDLMILPGVGHQPMWEGDGTELVSALDRFARPLY